MILTVDNPKHQEHAKVYDALGRAIGRVQRYDTETQVVQLYATNALPHYTTLVAASGPDRVEPLLMSAHIPGSFATLHGRRLWRREERQRRLATLRVGSSIRF